MFTLSDYINLVHRQVYKRLNGRVPSFVLELLLHLLLPRFIRRAALRDLVDPYLAVD